MADKVNWHNTSHDHKIGPRTLAVEDLRTAIDLAARAVQSANRIVNTIAPPSTHDPLMALAVAITALQVAQAGLMVAHTNYLVSLEDERRRIEVAQTQSAMEALGRDR